MYYNGKKNGISVHQFMEQVHGSMKLKYSHSNTSYTTDIIQANQLQNFFQDLKSVANNGTANFFDQMIIEQILKNMQAGNSFMNKNFLTENLFSATGIKGGFSFERQLSAIIEVVMKSVATEDFEFDKTQVLLGGDRGTTIGLDEIDLSDASVQKFLKKIGTKTQRFIENENTQSKLKQYYLPEVDGKIDVKGYSILVRADADARLIQIYNLLKDATFSAKNYSSMRFDEKQKMFIEAVGRNNLYLGKSNILRSIYGSLKEFSPDPKTTQSAIFAGYNAIARGDTDVANHFYHLRYMYELMGTGITYNGTSFGNVRFLIFNDPHGNIYVKSTGEIFSDIIEETLSNKNKWKMGITVPKEKFY